MAAAIERKLGVQPTLIKGDRGIFDVKADGDLVYSKYETGRFPTHEEILATLEARAS